MKTIKAVVESIQMVEGKDDKATGICQVRDINRTFLIWEGYQKIDIEVDGLRDMDILKDLGIKIDFSDIKEKFKELLAEAKKKKLSEQQKKNEEDYENHPFVKDISIAGTRLTMTKEECIKGECSSLRLVHEENYKGKEVKVYITREAIYGEYSWRNSGPKGYRFYVKGSDDYGSNKGWTTSVKKLPEMYKTKLQSLKDDIDYKIKAKEEGDKRTSTVRDIFGKDVQEKSVYKLSFHHGGHGYSEKVYSTIEEKDYNSRGINFNLLDDKAQSFKIDSIEGKFTVDQMKALIEIVKKAKFN